MLQVMFRLSAKENAFFKAITAIVVAMADTIRANEGISSDEDAYLNMWAESTNYVTEELGRILQISSLAAARAMWEAAYDVVEFKNDKDARFTLITHAKRMFEREHNVVINWCFIPDDEAL